MASIQINALNPAGSDLFADDESYLKELTDAELNNKGGLFLTTVVPITFSLWLMLQ